MDSTLSSLGADRLIEVEHGDELSGQEDSFNTWLYAVFKVRLVYCIFVKF